MYLAIQDGVMYKFYNDNITSWLDGQKQCLQEGGHLVTLETDRKWKFVKEEIQNLSNPEDNEWFIGLNRSSEKSNWTWVTGKPLSLLMTDYVWLLPKNTLKKHAGTSMT